MKYITLVGLIALYSCSSSPGKKVFIEASGKVQVNENTVNFTPGGSHNEVTLEPTAEKITVVTPEGNKDYPVADAGVYVLNLKKDTIVGSYQRIGSDNSRTVLTEADLIERVDSLNQLMAGTNVTETSRSFNIPPSTIRFISKNTEAQIIGPYLHIPGSFDPSKEHEVYKFFTNREVRETAARLQTMLKK